MSMFQSRNEYGARTLRRRDLADDPVEQFARWFAKAVEAELPEPSAMTLATAAPDGQPSARMILLKGFDEHGFTFFTNYASPKARELDANPHAAMVFWWDRLERQVRVAGGVERVSHEESEAYHRTRPRLSQIGAFASSQSQVIPNREALEERFAQVQDDYAGRDVPLPANWGGYRLVPIRYEFWQGRPNRLHDRFRYTREADGTWTIARLSP
jgi:pyridoxamine 5'-phosphate oxidase